MPASFRVRLAKDYLTFCAAHFVTFQGDTCEPLHGHNYGVMVELDGPLDRDCFVVDFVAALELLRELVKELDHRVLLPTRHAMIQVTVADASVEARFRDRRWVFPREDCVLLPVENTSAELLARYLGERLLVALHDRLAVQPTRLGVEVSECAGQSALYIWTP